MKYIKKNFGDPIVKKHCMELRAAQLDSTSLSDTSVYPGIGGTELYQKIRSTEIIPHFGDLKNLLNQEQGGICCYCGSKLFYPDSTHYSVEHVYPKGKDRTLVGEYSNLLLSCKYTDEDRQNIKKSYSTKRERLKHYHCDEAKGHDVLNYTPLQPNCAEHFEYDIDGYIKGLDDKAEKDIQVLGLNCDELVRRRKAAIDATIFDEEWNMIDTDTLTEYADKVMEKREGMHNEYCFVLSCVLKKYRN